MVLGWALAVVGTLLVYMGFEDVSLVDVLSGETKHHGQDTASAIAETQSNVAGIIDTTNAAVAIGTKDLPRGLAQMDGKPVAKWIYKILVKARRDGVHFHISSGYRSYQDQVRVCATGVHPCAKPGTSHHQGKSYPSGAVDIDSGASELCAWLKKHPAYNRLLQCPPSEDPVHFSHHSGGSY